MSEPISVGVIGAGFGQQVHVPAFRSDGRCVVAGICASTCARAQKVADRLGIPRAYGDWRAMVADPGISALAIAVPPALQATIVREAAAAGKHVFCEKPAAADVTEAEAMLRTVEDARVAHAVNFLFPEVETWKRAKLILGEQTLGALRHVALTWRVETYAQRTRLDSWKRRREDGGGTLNNFASHSLFYLHWLFGPPAIVAARLSPAGEPGDSRVDVWVEFDGGATGTIGVASDAFLGSGHRLEVYGEEGTLTLENRTADHVSGFELVVGTRETGELRPVSIEVDPGPGIDGRIGATAAIVRRFVDAIATGTSASPNLRDGLLVQRMIEAIRAVDRSGTRPPSGAVLDPRGLLLGLRCERF